MLEVHNNSGPELYLILISKLLQKVMESLIKLIMTLYAYILLELTYYSSKVLTKIIYICIYEEIYKYHLIIKAEVF